MTVVPVTTWGQVSMRPVVTVMRTVLPPGRAESGAAFATALGMVTAVIGSIVAAPGT